MEKNYQIVMFGKKGCDKCKVLKERLDSLLKKDQYQDFEREYYDVETLDGIVKFAKAEVLNPQRIPSFFVQKRRLDGEFEPLANPVLASDNSLSRPWKYVGIETDYSEKGRGLITPQMVTKILDTAKAL